LRPVATTVSAASKYITNRHIYQDNAAHKRHAKITSIKLFFILPGRIVQRNAGRDGYGGIRFFRVIEL